MQGYTFQKLSHINPEDTFIQVFVEALNEIFQTHYKNVKDQGLEFGFGVTIIAISTFHKYL